MSAFTARSGFLVARESNSVTVQAQGEAAYYGKYAISYEIALALEDFFQHERDKQLGRWRWPENPDYVVYPSAIFLTPSDNDLAMVVNEVNGQGHRVRRDDPDRLFGFFSEAGAAYFDAHPGPKPWHDAKPGDVWVVTTQNVADEVAVRAVDVNGSMAFKYDGRGPFSIHDPRFVSGRRIWPEVTS